MSQYTPRDFFRRAPKHLLGRYFHERGLLTDIDFAQLKENEFQLILDTWNALPEKVRRQCDGELIAIHDIACDMGIKAILDAVKRTGFDAADDLPVLFSSKASQLERALVAFLDFKDYWPQAQQFFFADNHAYWRKSRNFLRKAVKCSKADRDKLARAIADYFHQTEGRGEHCEVDYARRNDLDYYTR